jgi:DNA-binding Lrp family transcriptional regulator
MNKRQLLLDRLQARFPIVERPFLSLGEELGIPEEEVVTQVMGVVNEGLLRRIGPFFDSRRLGLKSTLVAARVEPGRVDAVAHEVNLFEEVTHNYLRSHHINLWFTLIAPCQERIDEIIVHVGGLPGVHELHDLPSRRLFKLNADFSTRKGALSLKRGRASVPVELDGREKRLIRSMQDGIPITLKPFESIAGELDEETRWVIDTIREWLECGVIRRFGGALRHHQAGFSHNAMVTWAVPESREEAVGNAFAGCREVSHCYLRPAFPGFPWTLYTMIHARSSREMQNILRKLKKKSGLDECMVLESAREYKKESPRYF